MRIAFLHAGLELGVDGVADYAHTLALELVRRGHSCAMVGLNDGVKAATRADYGADGVSLPVLRLPKTQPWTTRLAAARPFLAEFGPDWCSLQFVCYGYHPKGIVRRVASPLAELVGTTPLHMLLHELWIGEHAHAPLKERIVGALQSYFVRRLLARLAPRVLHVTNPTYINVLRNRGITARCLPLFGAIPITAEPADTWLFPELRGVSADFHPAHRAQWWLFGFFGSFHSVWPPEPLLSRIATAAAVHGRRVALIALGGLGPGAERWEQMAREHAHRFAFLRLGRRSAQEVSQFLNSVDFGVATSPWSLVGKSSTVAAMLEHDLPVIVNREDGLGRGLDAEPLEGFARFIRLDAHFQARLGQARTRQPKSRLTAVTDQFLAALGIASGAATRPVEILETR